ncbi:hypothetical protein IQ255_21990 [Pleurocapsales cyanobacterium LEGE 10410]|nr:hypothetical protein [Pleurocapsales cyanobacterium LEGE 10410]
MMVRREVNSQIYWTGSKLLVGVALSLLVSGCGESKYTQCEQIFRIVRNVTENSQDVNYNTKDGQPTEMNSWLQAASMMNTAADRLQALQINNGDLSEYQNQFAIVYRSYSQATYDAVQARENQNLEALKSARNDAATAGQMQQQLIKEINAYCLDQ